MIFQSKQAPWIMAQFRIGFVQFITLPLAISEQYWKAVGKLLDRIEK